MAKLVVVTQGLAGLTIELGGNPTSIGRAYGNALQIIETTVSSRHCEAVLRGNDLYIRDLRSTNGTFVQGERVTEAVLKPGQTFRVGAVEIRYEASVPAMPAGFSPKSSAVPPVAAVPVAPKPPVVPPVVPKPVAATPVVPPASPKSVPPPVIPVVTPRQAVPMVPVAAKPVSVPPPAAPNPAPTTPVAPALAPAEARPTVPVAATPAVNTPVPPVPVASPASVATPLAAPVIPPAAPKIELPPEVSKKSHVLFVDDDEEFLSTFGELCSVFSDNVWEIYSAPTADRALSTLQKFAIDLVVLDISMPMVDGIQLLGIIVQRYPDVKIAVLTGTSSETNRTTCLAKGAELFIEKPVSGEGFKVVFNMLNDLMLWTHREGFSGTIRQVGLQEVIQMECLGRHSSVLEVRNLKTHGMIYIDSGAIVHATAGVVTGEKALQRLLALPGGQFKLQPYAVPTERTMQGSWEFLLMEAARVRDEETDTTLRTKASVLTAAKPHAQAQTQGQSPAQGPGQPAAAESASPPETNAKPAAHSLGDDIVVVATYDGKDGKWNPSESEKK